MIRQFSPDQLDQVTQIWLQTNITAHSFIPREYWENHCAQVRMQLPLADIYVYEENTFVRGFIGITGQRYIAGLFVAEGWQQNGIGSKLLAYCQGLYPLLELDVYVKNKRAVAFYCRSGFQITARMNSEDNGEPEYHMSWHKKQTATPN